MILTLILAYPMDASAKKRNYSHQTVSDTDSPKYASIVVDAQTGAILSQDYPDRLVHPASLTKVMTLLLLFEAMESGNVRLNDRILISDRANSMAPSKLGLPSGSSIRVEDAILAVVTKSANDIAYAIAEHLAGSPERFAERMNYRAKSIGMIHTNFRNPHGLDDPRQVTTARDMATLARYVIVRYPNYYRYFGTKQFTYRGKTYTNHNRLMLTYPGMDGFKTGFINSSGFNLIASAKHGDRRLIGVVFGGRSWKSRNDKMASLLNTGFSRGNTTRFASIELPPATSNPAIGNAPVPVAKPAVPAAMPATQAGMPATASVSSDNSNFTSLSSLGTNTAGTIPNAAPAAPDVTGDAIAKVTTAMDRGDYSEITGEGDLDPGTAKRVETGLLSAAVYKGEARVQKKNAALSGTVQNLADQLPQAANDAATVQDVAVTSQAPQDLASTAPSNLWSVQIGAYNSRVVADDKLRSAISKLPGDLSHASPMVVPLQTSEGLLFRGRIGNLTQAQATQACRYFRDCLPIAPR